MVSVQIEDDCHLKMCSQLVIQSLVLIRHQILPIVSHQKAVQATQRGIHHACKALNYRILVLNYHYLQYQSDQGVL